MYSNFIKISMVVHKWAEHSQISTIQTATLVHSVSCLSVCICLVQHTVKLVYAIQFAKLFILRSMAWGVGSSMENGKRWPWLLYYHRVTHLLVVVGFLVSFVALPAFNYSTCTFNYNFSMSCCSFSIYLVHWTFLYTYIVVVVAFQFWETPCISVNCWLINYCDMHSMFSNKW